jgi:hypothetical protein
VPLDRRDRRVLEYAEHNRKQPVIDMFKTKHLFIALSAVLLISAATQAADLGKVNIPVQVKLKGMLIEPGLYTFALETMDGKLFIQLKRGGKVVADELAITKPAEKVHKTARLAYQPLKRDGATDPVLSRVLCSYEGKLYLLYFEKP